MWKWLLAAVAFFYLDQRRENDRAVALGMSPFPPRAGVAPPVIPQGGIINQPPLNPPSAQTQQAVAFLNRAPPRGL